MQKCGTCKKEHDPTQQPAARLAWFSVYIYTCSIECLKTKIKELEGYGKSL